MNQFRELATSVKRKLAVRFGLALLVVAFFGLYSVRFYIERTEAYNQLLIMEDLQSPEAFSPGQLQYIRDHVTSIEGRMLRELIISNIVVVVVFSFFSYYLAQGLFDSLSDSVERERRFLDDASHELRTPLTAISSIAETTLRSQHNSPQHYLDSLEQIFDESKRLTGTINDFLFLSRSDNNKIKLELGKHDLSKLILSTIKPMQHLANKKSITLETSGTEKEVNVEADSSKIKQLLTILIDNAIKYSPEGSRVEIKVENKPKPRVSVIDCGKGIDPEDLPHIFDRFYRSDKSRSTSGSGLGLSIAQWIAEVHNARIDVKSVPGKGSTFDLIFN